MKAKPDLYELSIHGRQVKHDFRIACSLKEFYKDNPYVLKLSNKDIRDYVNKYDLRCVNTSNHLNKYWADWKENIVLMTNYHLADYRDLEEKEKNKRIAEFAIDICRFKDFFTIAIYRKDGDFFDRIIRLLYKSIYGKKYTYKDQGFYSSALYMFRVMKLSEYSDLSIEQFVDNFAELERTCNG